MCTLCYELIQSSKKHVILERNLNILWQIIQLIVPVSFSTFRPYFHTKCNNILQNELDALVCLWNNHRIRPSENLALPYGRPVIMYGLPHLYGAQNHLCEVDQDMVSMLLPFADCWLPGSPSKISSWHCILTHVNYQLQRLLSWGTATCHVAHMRTHAFWLLWVPPGQSPALKWFLGSALNARDWSSVQKSPSLPQPSSMLKVRWHDQSNFWIQLVLTETNIVVFTAC